MNRSAQGEDGLFRPGPPLNLHGWLDSVKPGVPNIARRVALAILIGWLPLVVLAAFTDGALRAFLSDFAAHAKYLIAVPVLVIADAACAPRLGAIARHFLDAGLVTAADRPRFDAAIASTVRLRDSMLAGIGVLVLAYAIVAVLFYSLHESGLRSWHQSGPGTGLNLSPAGWWVLLVSLPLLLTLILGWAWRWFLWARFLWLMARLDLRLVPSHPDRAGGLRFAAYSVRAWWPLGLAFGAIVAGDPANAVAHQGAALPDYKYLVVEAAALSVAFFTAPLLVFSAPLLKAWRRGVFEYGALADRFGQQFERRWLVRDSPVDESVLERPDFSTATDLYQVVDRVHDMQLAPIDLRGVVMLAFATLLPFVPVVLMALPFSTILDRIAGLLL